MPGIASGFTRSGKPRKRPTRPRLGLKDRLENLYLLLRVPSFSRWPLQVRFFDDEAYKLWTSKVVDSNDSVKTVLDLPVEQTADSTPVDTAESNSPPKRKRRKKADDDTLLNAAAHVVNKGGVEGLDVSYKHLRPALQKSRFVLAEGETVQCAVCAEDIKESGFSSTLLCPKEGCSSTSHLMCLSKHFLGNELRTPAQTVQPIIPKEGSCPNCGEELQWMDLISALTLRLRDTNMVDKILEPRKDRRKKDDTSKSNWKTQMVVLDTEEEDEAAEPDIRIFSDVDEEDDFEHDEPGASDDDDDDDDETLRLEEVVDEPLLHVAANPNSVSSANSGTARRGPAFRMPRSLGIVEDSDEEARRIQT